jgi:hypothetical protein
MDLEGCMIWLNGLFDVLKEGVYLYAGFVNQTAQGASGNIVMLGNG